MIFVGFLDTAITKGSLSEWHCPVELLKVKFKFKVLLKFLRYPWRLCLPHWPAHQTPTPRQQVMGPRGLRLLPKLSPQKLGPLSGYSTVDGFSTTLVCCDTSVDNNQTMKAVDYRTDPHGLDSTPRDSTVHVHNVLRRTFGWPGCLTAMAILLLLVPWRTLRRRAAVTAKNTTRWIRWAVYVMVRPPDTPTPRSWSQAPSSKWRCTLVPTSIGREVNVTLPAHPKVNRGGCRRLATCSAAAVVGTACGHWITSTLLQTQWSGAGQLLIGFAAWHAVRYFAVLVARSVSATANAVWHRTRRAYVSSARRAGAFVASAVAKWWRLSRKRKIVLLLAVGLALTASRGAMQHTQRHSPELYTAYANCGGDAESRRKAKARNKALRKRHGARGTRASTCKRGARHFDNLNRKSGSYLVDGGAYSPKYKPRTDSTAAAAATTWAAAASASRTRLGDADGQDGHAGHGRQAITRARQPQRRVAKNWWRSTFWLGAAATACTTCSLLAPQVLPTSQLQRSGQQHTLYLEHANGTSLPLLPTQRLTFDPHVGQRIGQALVPGPPPSFADIDAALADDDIAQFLGGGELAPDLAESSDDDNEVFSARGGSDNESSDAHDSDSVSTSDAGASDSTALPGGTSCIDFCVVPPWDARLQADQIAGWKGAEEALGIKRSVKSWLQAKRKKLARTAAAPSLPTPLPEQNFVAALSYAGAVTGFYFGTKEDLLGYHRDTRKGQLFEISLVDLLEVGEENPVPAEPQKGTRRKRDAAGKRIRGRSRRWQALRTSPQTEFLLANANETEIAARPPKNSGLVLVDTVNPNCWATGSRQVVQRTTADIILMQDTKVRLTRTAGTQTQAGRLGWRMR